MVPTSIRSTKPIVPGQKASRGVGQTSVFLIFDHYFPMCRHAWDAKGKTKRCPGVQPEMASGTLPLLRRFGSRHDELITREKRVHEGEYLDGGGGSQRWILLAHNIWILVRIQNYAYSIDNIDFSHAVKYWILKRCTREKYLVSIVRKLRIICRNLSRTGNVSKINKIRLQQHRQVNDHILCVMRYLPFKQVGRFQGMITAHSDRVRK